MARSHLTLYDYSDRELLLMMIDLGTAESGGWVHVHDLAEALQIDHKRPGQCVGTRLGWLRKFGATDRKDSSPEWRPTKMGEALAAGSLSELENSVLEALTTEQMLTLTRTLTNRYRRVGATAAHLMRREWQAGTFGRFAKK